MNYSVFRSKFQLAALKPSPAWSMQKQKVSAYFHSCLKISNIFLRRNEPLRPILGSQGINVQPVVFI